MAKLMKFIGMFYNIQHGDSYSRLIKLTVYALKTKMVSLKLLSRHDISAAAGTIFNAFRYVTVLAE